MSVSMDPGSTAHCSSVDTCLQNQVGMLSHRSGLRETALSEVVTDRHQFLSRAHLQGPVTRERVCGVATTLLPPYAGHLQGLCELQSPQRVCYAPGHASRQQ